MARKAYPRYTQESVAFPSLNDERGVIDSIHVEFHCKATENDGVYGSGVTFKFRRFDSGGTGLEVSGWDDGLENLMDPRMQAVLADLRKLRLSRNRKGMFGYSKDSATPAEVIAVLEANGITASKYQLGVAS